MASADTSLHDALSAWIRELRAGKWWDRAAVRGVSTAIETALAAQDSLRLQFAADSLSVAGFPTVAFDPKAIPEAARIFEHGVRRITLLPGFGYEELASLTDALAADLRAPEFAEDDITTLLADRDLPHVRFVVAEAADARVVSNPALGGMMETLPEVSDAGGRASGREDAQLRTLREHTREALRRPTRQLTSAVLGVLTQLPAEEAERLARILGWQLEQQLASHGFQEVEPHVAAMLAWAREHGTSTMTEAFLHGALGESFQRAAIGAVARQRSAIVLDVLRLFADRPFHAALEVLWRRSPSAELVPLVMTFLRGARAGAPLSTDQVASTDPRVVLGWLQSIRAHAADAESMAFHQAALRSKDARVRLVAVSWLFRCDPARPGDVLGPALRDREQMVRAGALLFLSRCALSAAHDVLNAWIEDDFFQELSLDEKRFGILVYARLSTDDVTPRLRALVDTSNVLRRQKADETRTAALAGLAFLQDPRVVEIANNAMKSPFALSALRREAEYLVRSAGSQTLPYEDPMVHLARVEQQIDSIFESSLGEPSASAERPSLGVSGIEAATVPPPRGGSSADVIATVPPEVHRDNLTLPPAAVPDRILDLMSAYSFDTLPPMPRTSEGETAAEVKSPGGAKDE